MSSWRPVVGLLNCINCSNGYVRLISSLFKYGKRKSAES